MKYTKGPWITCGISGRMIQPKSKEGTQYFIADVDIIDNARLISCAPEMLDYLIDYLKSRLTGIAVKQEFFNANPKLVNLIEKATGLTIEEVLKCQSLSE